MLDARRHDAVTAIAIAVVAFVVADLSHEGLGHGVAAHLQDAKLIVLSYTYLTSDIQSKWISVSGPLVNLVEGSIALAILPRIRLRTGLSFFIFLLAMFNLLDAAAYLVYSGAFHSGDLAVVIAGWPHLGLIRAAMVVTGLGCYAAITRFGAGKVQGFAEPRGSLTTSAYVSTIVLNAAAAVMNPFGLKYFLISALPTTAGANAGLLAMPGLAERRGAKADGSMVLGRSYGWVVAGALATALFILLIGRGVRLVG